MRKKQPHDTSCGSFGKRCAQAELNGHAKELFYPVLSPGALLPFLLALETGKSRNHVKGLLSRGQVTVNSRPVTRFDHPLRPGDQVRMMARAPVPPPLPVLYEDEELIAVDKPAGLLTMATDREKEKTAYHMLTAWRRALLPDGRVFILHRLDRDTSGVLVFAKSEAAKRAFQDRWGDIARSRTYLAVTEGAPAQDTGLCRSYLKETAAHVVYESDRPGDGREAVTRYTVLARGERYALLRLELETGRKNQIRVHLRGLGCPVTGDRKYGAAANPMGRLALHAWRLTLAHPETGALLTVVSPPPAPFARLFPDIKLPLQAARHDGSETGGA